MLLCGLNSIFQKTDILNLKSLVAISIVLVLQKQNFNQISVFQPSLICGFCVCFSCCR